MKKRRQVGFLGFGSIPTTSIEIEQPQADPTTIKAEKLKANAQRILADNAQREKDYEARRAHADALKKE
jgi:hypothetical protein